MAPLFTSQIARAVAADNDDSFGIKNVSGFYGPGSWIALLLTLSTSWIAVLLNDHSHNLHHIGYLFYVNWAAVDVIRVCAQYATDVDKLILRTNGPLCAALLVIWWGVTHALSQHAFTYFFNAFFNGLSSPVDERRRCRLLELGVLLPVIAGLVLLRRLTQSGRHDEIYLELLSYDMEFTFPQLIVPVECICIAAFMFGRLVTSRNRHFAPLAWMYLPLCMAPPYWAMVYLCHSIARPWKKICFFMPCAPQTLPDWDQAFAVFVGVVMGVYELGPKALPLVLLKVKGFLNACRLRIWSSRDPAP
jgi:hypothetical protein